MFTLATALALIAALLTLAVAELVIDRMEQGKRL
jgi:hypothetical protein